MTRKDIEAVQRSLNHFVKKYLRGVNPLRVDGELGAATNRRIKWVKYYLGYGKTAGQNSAEPSSKFVRSLRHPKDPRYNTRAVLRAGAKRRLRQRARWRAHQVRAAVSPGVTRYDGVPVAKWLVPYLRYARTRGWRGKLVSGWRSPAYSDSLCRRMCGRPSCPGKCAGRASNHAGSARPRGALDVSDYARFGQLVRGYGNPHIFNALGARDPVHFSASGR